VAGRSTQPAAYEVTVKRVAAGVQERLGKLSRPRKTYRSPLRDQCYTDVMSTDELLAEALRLTRVDRARVAEELLSSLEESDDELATAWATELERRSRDVAEGRVQTTSWDTARTEILKELEQRRAPRTTS
jgi:putative addiction module component (TIGR02574 family)